MSNPKYIRLAIESCRRSKSTVPQLRPGFYTRAYASKRPTQRDSITQGFPLPPGAHSISETPSEGSQTLADLPDAPPRRKRTTVARSQSDSSQPAEATEVASTDESTKPVLSRPPLNVLAAYHRPLKHIPKYGVPSCDLQLRSFSVRNLEFMADFALRAAYYLNLPASGPTPLPKRIERWTALRSNFVNKKSQENFERITYKRLVQIQDGHRDVVEVWLSFLRRHQFYGVGMKANVWEYEALDVPGMMDKQMQEVQKDLDEKLGMFGWNKQVADMNSVADLLQKQGPRQVGVPMTIIRQPSQTATNKQ